MSPVIPVGVAQLGPIQRADSRASVIDRMLVLLERAHRKGVGLLVYPELTFTTFFPRWYHEDVSEADHFYERELPSPATARLFDAARGYGIALHVGYAELLEAGSPGNENGPARRFNTAAFVADTGEIVFKYRKIHLPGHKEFEPQRAAQHLEKRYFEVGDLGFPVVRAPVGEHGEVNLGMLICNDRRWPEAWRVLGLQKAQLVMLGYNTPSLNMERKGFEAHHLRVLHSHLSIQSGCYQNSCFAAASAKAGTEDGHELFGHSIIVNPQGEILAQATSWDDELIIADCDIGRCALGAETIFNFEKHRRPEHYGPIVEQVGAREPVVWKRGQA